MKDYENCEDYNEYNYCSRSRRRISWRTLKEIGFLHPIHSKRGLKKIIEEIVIERTRLHLFELAILLYKYK